MTFLGVPTPLWGGIIGSTLTYGATYLRERRKLDDAYRSPQRQALADIIAAANEMKVCASEIADHVGITRAQTSDDAAVKSLNNFLRALLGVEKAFAVGKLTVVEAACYEQMQVAYNEYSQLRRNTDFDELARTRDWLGFMDQLSTYMGILDAEVVKLVNISKDKLSPTQTKRNKTQVKVAQKRLSEKYGGSVTPPQSPGGGQG
ncbi:hypothetical protein V7968_09420 [Nocardia vulneris]|uniref:hypothetical protein n=1 Tax=Nocardia vulneris TaxID=1141657 RepID=UPI0030D2EF65